MKAAAYRPSIDGLRALAILSVIGFHAFPAWMPGGFIGVDVFFVISGFLISGILLEQLRQDRFSLRGFYARRVRRIFPALLVVLTAVLVAGWFILWPDAYGHLAEHALASAGFVVNLLLAQETGYFDGHSESKPLLHLWSLGVEEQFYLVWPLMLWAGWKIRHHAGAMIAVVFAASFAASLWLVNADQTADFYWPVSRFWELLAGGALAWSGKVNRTSSWLAWGGIALLALCVFALSSTLSFPGAWALLPVAGAVLLIAAGDQAWINRVFLAHPVMVWVGLISYPLYLWHWPLLAFARVVQGGDLSRVVRIELVGAAFVLATLTYYAVERPLRRGASTDKKVFILLAAMIALAGFAGSILQQHGFPARFAALGVSEESLDSDRLIAHWQQQVRMNQCHWQDPKKTIREATCIEEARPLVLLWGDSHAASLYPGLKALQDTHRFGIAQMTQAGCPPLLDIPRAIFRPDCNAVNRDILTRVGTLKPALILLAAAFVHPDYPMDQAEILERLDATLAQVKTASPQSQIVVIGPAPHWPAPMPALYRRALIFAHHLPPAFMPLAQDTPQTQLDAVLRDHLAQGSVQYLSPQKELCDTTGCLTRWGDSTDHLTFIDDEHVSSETAAFLVKQWAVEILSALDMQ